MKKILLFLSALCLLTGCSNPKPPLPEPGNESKSVKLTKENSGLTTEDSKEAFTLSLAIEGSEEVYQIEMGPNLYNHPDYEEFVMKKDGYIKSVDDIDKIEIMLIDRKSLHDGIVSILGNTSFMDVENELLDREAYDNAVRPCAYKKGIKFVLSNDLAEAPICAVLKKDFLKKYAKGHYMVTKEKIEKI